MMAKLKTAVKNFTVLHIMFLTLILGTFLYILMAGKHVDSVTKEKKILVEEGLSTKGKHFTMQGKKFTILSGAIHYFRVPTDYWDDRLLKLKGMGLNTVET